MGRRSNTVSPVEVEHIPWRAGLTLQIAMFAGNEPRESFIEIRPLEPVGRQEFISVRDVDRAVRAVERLREHHATVCVGVAPRIRRCGRVEAIERVWALPADLDTKESVALLRTFRPRPSIVARSRTRGRLHAYWQLRGSVPPAWARRATLRLATELRADPAVSDAARVMRAPTKYVHLDPVAYSLAEVVGGLPDARKWTARARAASRHVAAFPDDILVGLAGIVRGAQEGERNTRLNWAAYRAGQHAAAGKLDHDRAREALLSAALDAGLPEHEAAATVRSGLDSGMGAVA